MKFLLGWLIVPMLVPWIVVICLIGRRVHAKAAREIFAVDKKASDELALESCAAALLFCTPIAFFVPAWSGIHILVYWVLSVGVQYYAVKENYKQLNTNDIWKWSWRSSGVTAGYSFLVWLVSVVVMVVFQGQLKPDHQLKPEPYQPPGRRVIFDEWLRNATTKQL